MLLDDLNARDAATAVTRHRTRHRRRAGAPLDLGGCAMTHQMGVAGRAARHDAHAERRCTP